MLGSASRQLEGLREGELKGLQEGERKALQDVALKLRSEGMDADQVARLTGLTASEFLDMKQPCLVCP